MKNGFNRSKPNCNVGPAPADETPRAAAPSHEFDGLFSPEPPFKIDPKETANRAWESIAKDAGFESREVMASAIDKEMDYTASEHGVRTAKSVIDLMDNAVRATSVSRLASTGGMKTVYKVPDHVGQNIEVPEGSIVTERVKSDTPEWHETWVETDSAAPAPGTAAYNPGMATEQDLKTAAQAIWPAIRKMKRQLIDASCAPLEIAPGDNIPCTEGCMQAEIDLEPLMSKYIENVTKQQITDLEDKILQIFEQAGFGKAAHKVFGR